MDTHDLVVRQFGPAAQAYATSPTHADLDALAHLCDLAQAEKEDEALDVATGAGNLALALAARVRKVVALDITPQMLEETARRAKEMGLTNVETTFGEAEDLPFPDASFTLAATRIGAHHFADVKLAIAEMARVLAPKGRLLVVDTVVPNDAELDEEINSIESIRDPSHVRDYSVGEWESMAAAEGLEIRHLEVGPHGGGALPFGPWVKRINTSPYLVPELRRRFLEASPKLREVLKIRVENDEIYFDLPQITLLAVKP